MKIVGIVIIVLIVLVVLYFISAYNSFVKLRNNVKEGWSQIDVQLKRRFDLIPNLLETVKGYMKHEKETLEAVVNARNSYASAKSNSEAMKADSDLTNTLNKLFALAESYPDLKANQNFLSMQGELSNTEDKISQAREYYNTTVNTYNTKTKMFPSNIVAGMFGFKEEAFFEAPEEQRENVKVEF